MGMQTSTNVRAEIMGRGKFGGGPGPWGDDPWTGWWGGDPPFHMPVFVLTHHEREPLTLSDTTFTFVTDGRAPVRAQRLPGGICGLRSRHARRGLATGIQLIEWALLRSACEGSSGCGSTPT